MKIKHVKLNLTPSRDYTHASRVVITITFQTRYILSICEQYKHEYLYMKLIF